jgi:hypothetical protein
MLEALRRLGRRISSLGRRGSQKIDHARRGSDAADLGPSFGGGAPPGYVPPVDEGRPRK